jgi:hypothetical protein
VLATIGNFPAGTAGLSGINKPTTQDMWDCVLHMWADMVDSRTEGPSLMVGEPHLPGWTGLQERYHRSREPGTVVSAGREVENSRIDLSVPSSGSSRRAETGHG